MISKQNSKLSHVLVSPDVHEQLRQFAFDRNISIRHVVDMAVTKYIKKQNKKENK